MADGPNGASGGGAFFSMTGDGVLGGDGMGAALPPAPGEAPVLQMPGPPAEHQTSVSSSTVPETVDYGGGGIFTASTPGPSEQSVEETQRANKDRGYDFGPSMAPSMSMPIPMAAHNMPDVGAPRTQGVFGQENSGSTLGMSILAVVGGSAIGGYYGGGYGLLAGGLFGGAAVNMYRAFSQFRKGTDDKEAAVSGTYAVGAAAIGAVIWAKLVGEPEPMTRNPRRKSNPDNCDIRPVGP